MTRHWRSLDNGLGLGEAADIGMEAGLSSTGRQEGLETIAQGESAASDFRQDAGMREAVIVKGETAPWNSAEGHHRLDP